jgi:hypothetical protein
MPRLASERHIDVLPEDLRDRVRERAAILWESGLDEDEANRRAYELESGQTFPGESEGPGPARARRRESESRPTSRARTGSSGSKK